MKTKYFLVKNLLLQTVMIANIGVVFYFKTKLLVFLGVIVLIVNYMKMWDIVLMQWSFINTFRPFFDMTERLLENRINDKD